MAPHNSVPPYRRGAIFFARMLISMRLPQGNRIEYWHKAHDCLPSPAGLSVQHAQGERSMHCIRTIISSLFIVGCLFAQSATATTQLPEWLQQGWHYLDQQQPELALKQWQHGMNQQPDKRLFAVLGAFREKDNAFKQLARIGREQQVFITVNPDNNYYILSARTVNPDKLLRQQELADLKKLAGIHGTLLARWAERFKTADRTDAPLTSSSDQLSTVMHSKQPRSKPDNSTLQTVMVRNNTPKPTASSQSNAAPAWLNEGFKKMSSGQTDQAMQVWQIGMNSLDDQQLFISLGVFAKLDNAVARATAVGKNHRLCIAMRHSGKALYYVLSFNTLPDKQPEAAYQQWVQRLQQAAGISSKLRAIEAANFKNHLILSHYPDIEKAPKHRYTPATGTTVTGNSVERESTAGGALIGHFDITGNQQVSTDAIILELAEFFDTANASHTHSLIKQRVENLYRDTGIDHVAITVSKASRDESVSITINESHE